jgi:GT2 family glycosyltransferase
VARDVPGDSTAAVRPALSICVPTYNRPLLVERTIRSIVEAASSVADQVEIIVSDNSPDVSESTCREALGAWPGRSLYVANRPNIGLTANFNQCIERASGRYVLFVQDDDRLLPGSVPAVLEVLRADAPGEVLLFGIDLVDEHGRLIRRQAFCRDHRVDGRQALHRLLSDNGLAWFPGLVLRRDAVEEVGRFDGAFANAMDFEMFVRLFARFGVRCLPTAISAYTVHGESATQLMGFDAEDVGRLIAVFERAKATGVLPDSTIRRCEADYLHQFILGAASVRVRQGDATGAREILSLFDLPAIRSLETSRVWRTLRAITGLLVRLPVALVRPLMTLVDRLDLARRVRAAQYRGRDGIQVC